MVRDGRCLTKTNPSFDTYCPVQSWSGEGLSTRPRVMTYVRRDNNLHTEQRSPTPSRDLLLLEVNDLTVINLYRNGPDALEALFRLQISQKTLVVGDFNARHHSWQPGADNYGQGADISDWASRNSLRLINGPGEPNARLLEAMLYQETVYRGRPKALCYEDILLSIVRHPETGHDVPTMAIKFIHHKGVDRKPKPTIFFFAGTRKLMFCIITVIVSLAIITTTAMPGHDIRLLALDGGGVRGLSSLMILQNLMSTIDPDAPPKPCDYFDMPWQRQEALCRNLQMLCQRWHICAGLPDSGRKRLPWPGGRASATKCCKGLRP
ncbi:hypothetical protein HIM_11336 [Hirsutella minnesotensis 3608]|uniref:Endonuclease/exonuclease/phosphatase domain-containing protein n=1 Tax=Hirsutella minnesotensis 3608 TaxID=1043627 RepID=A0A0F7ZWN4_9HYPO|nr:hypothetical protein HIM_11336 [Hirsutella minnesotensis 3608]